MKGLALNHTLWRFIVGIPIVFLLFFTIIESQKPLGQFLATALTMLIVGGAVREYYTIAKVKGYAPFSFLGISFAMLYVLGAFLSTQYVQAETLPKLILAATFFLLFLCFLKKGGKPLQNLAISLFPIPYLAIPLSCILLILYYPFQNNLEGRGWVAYLFAVTMVTNIGGYCFGSLFGKSKLAPYISPGKSWEGALGGFLLAYGVSLAFYYKADLFSLSFSFREALLLGALLSILAQLGDLAESLLKRDAGVKDSADIPGLGGILDAVDSFVFTSPCLYLFLEMQGGR